MLNYTVIEKSNIDPIYLFHFRYTADKRTRMIWEWEYGKSNPNKSLLIAAIDPISNDVVASQGIIEYRLCCNNKVYTTGKNESLLIDYEYRGKGVSSKLYDFSIKEYTLNGFEFIWGFSRKAIGPLKRAGFDVFENSVRRMVLVTSNKQAIYFLAKKNNIKRPFLQTAVFFASVYARLFLKLRSYLLTMANSEIEVVNELKDNSDILALYEMFSTKEPNLIYVHQDKNFIDWRIKKSPLEIKTFYLYENEKLKAYLYITIRDRFLEITDLTFEHKSYGERLLNQLFSLMKETNLKVVYYTGNRHNNLNKTVFRLLFSYGFLSSEGPNSLVFRNLSLSNKKEFTNISNWYLNDLWSEGI